MINGDEFLLLFGGQGRINIKYRDAFLYVKDGCVQDDWIASFIEAELLSEAKLEQARHAVH